MTMEKQALEDVSPIKNVDVPCFMLVFGGVIHHFKDKQSPCKTTIEGFAVIMKVISFHYPHLSQDLNVCYMFNQM